MQKSSSSRPLQTGPQAANTTTASQTGRSSFSSRHSGSAPVLGGSSFSYASSQMSEETLSQGASDLNGPNEPRLLMTVPRVRQTNPAVESSRDVPGVQGVEKSAVSENNASTGSGSKSPEDGPFTRLVQRLAELRADGYLMNHIEWREYAAASNSGR